MPDILWCEPDVAPFDALPIVPIDYSEKQMRGTIYESAYLDEHLQNTVDNLNLLYVAFTRAIRHLFVIGQRGSKNNRSTLIEQVLSEIQLEGAKLQGKEDERSPLEFTFGDFIPLPSNILNLPIPFSNLLPLSTFRWRVSRSRQNSDRAIAVVIS